MKSVITTIVFSFLVIFSAFANNNTPTNNDSPVPTDNCFFLDPEEKVVFIDFEEINGFAKEIIVKNENDEVIFQAQLWDLVDLNGNIYEWSYADENAANITIELYTFTKVLTTEVEVETMTPLASK